MPEDQMLNMDKVVFFSKEVQKSEINEHVSLGLCHWFESNVDFNI